MSHRASEFSNRLTWDFETGEFQCNDSLSAKRLIFCKQAAWTGINKKKSYLKITLKIIKKSVR